MSDLDLSGVAAARARIGALEDQLRLTRRSLSEAAALGAAARARGDAAVAADAEARADQLRRHLDTLVKEVRASTTAVRGLSDALLTAVSPENAVTSLSGRHPVLLLPVRVETRFFDGGQTLKVRIFPDQTHVTAHDPAITTDERDGLTWYWTHRWPDLDAAGDRGRALAEEAWQALTARFRPGRAAFLVRAHPPVNVGSGEAEPRWGDLPLRSGEWSTAARAALLPDRWCVLGFRDAGEGRHQEIFRRWSAAVPDALAAGPTPDPGAPAEPGGLPDDPDLLWLHDAGEAERLGMLVTIRQADLVAGASLAQGVDRLVVVGVDWTLDPAQAAAAVDAHLAAHANEGRLAFVPQGVPTNSTGTTRSGFSTDISVARQVLAPHAAPATVDGAAGPVTAAALGIPAATLSGVAGADLREQAWQGALLDATWSAAGGYYLTEMLDPVADDPKIEASLRQHVASHLRASGPIPTMRIGAQPYGLLPVTPRGRFEPDARRRAQADVQRVTSALRELVEPLVASVPRLAQVNRREDVDDVLLALLQRTPVAWSLTFRNLVGPVERRAVSVNWDMMAAFQRDVTATLLSRLGCYQLTLLSELTHDDRDHPLDVPLVLKPDPIPTDPKRQSTAYLAEVHSLLTEPDGVDILDARKDSVALLEAFVACAAVNENRKAGKRVVAAQAASLQLSEQFVAYLNRPADRVPYTLRVESSPVAPAAAGVTVAVPSTPREFGQTVIPALTGDRTVAQHVAALYRERLARPGVLDVPDDPLQQLQRMGTALGTLEQAPADQLEWAFRGVLDLYATRLDAWITSLATARLAEHRTAASSGVHVGGWGVVEDLRPDRGPGAESLGFVHAPSLAQAASVAVLRSARQTHRDDEGRMFDLDLTSRRVRQALRILEGVGSGQRLAALLGYRIERGLQERDLSLAQWILPLRQQCPLRSERPDDPEHVEPVEVVAARDVVDGVALLERWRTDGTGLLAAAGIPTGAARAGVAAVLDEVAALSDAVADVLVSEAVHQATTGNLERSGAALAAHDRQDPPPDPEFVRTPRGGAVLTHRVGLWLPREGTSPAHGWARDLRSIAEPRLDRWLGGVLGDPSRWTVGARLVRPGADGTPPTIVLLPEIGVDALGLSALSLVLAARRLGSGPTELESRLALHVSGSPAVQAAGVSAEDRLELGSEGLAPLFDLAAWAAEVMGGAPLAADHLASSADVGAGVAGPAATVDVAEAVARAEAVLSAVETAVTEADRALGAHLAAPDADTESQLFGALLGLVEVEGPDALPAEDPLETHTASVVARVRTRLNAARGVPLPDPPAVEPGDLPSPGLAEDPRLVQARGVVRVLLGNAQPFLPVLRPTDPVPMAAALAGRDGLLAQDPTAVVSWLHRSALVRPQLDPLAALLVHAEADGADVGANLTVVQTPYAPDTPWIALPFGAAGPPPPGAVGLVLHAPEGLDPVTGGAGLVADSWTESVPAREETTAVTFHYDAPGARAPQAMLLAVHPARSPDRWDFDTLLGCVQEAVDLAHLRTVGAKELAPFTTFLPALFLPDVYTRDVAGIRFGELAAAAKVSKTGGLLADHVLGKR
ncbi:hypothetical protein Pth03_26370 [Planotetraspora thailandica]|uniref:Uncharacterized protein n=1 Tax=Planotetraspora thailandica TaxID=487172 RepID=A0A8J3UZX2_9ACTN|nr:hypothetical protein [Planotetraspora thailandica]GII54248.1 hypothetical protein Pth03_26370 [Planotetraspora thailandica]